ncbi:hypothetical protein FPQ18DRAFT_385479 [Pyronema domesticum]|nr:hypothetical protein FPQ18DRAFT_385479 [Pyronema domesticum]
MKLRSGRTYNNAGFRNRQGELPLQETIYAHCVGIFISHFLNRLGPELLDIQMSEHTEILGKLKCRLRQETSAGSGILPTRLDDEHGSPG